MKRLIKNQKGFTLVEILVVIVIIGILFTVILPRIDFASDKARQTGVKTDFRTFSIASERFINESAGDNLNLDGFNSYLDQQMKLNGVTTANKKVSTVTGRTVALNSNKQDPWGGVYNITVSDPAGARASVVVKSTGKTGDATNPDFVMATYYSAGEIDTCTSGFDSGDITLKSFTYTTGVNGKCGDPVN